MNLSDIKIIAGPCSAESREQVLSTAIQLSASGVKAYRAGLWKPRTMPGGFEGVGEKGLSWLKEVKEQTGMLVATEVATPAHFITAYDSGVDIMWIGARTVSNPFAVQELADAMKGCNATVLVKNPLSPDLELWCGAIERLSTSVNNIGAIHRGFSSYGEKIYRNSPIWQIPIEFKRRYPNIPLFCDPSHIGGKREFISPLCQRAMDLNFNGLFIESHCKPEYALSDSSQQVTPNELSNIIKSIVIKNNSLPIEDIATYRKEIDQIDTEIFELLSQRMKVSRKIGQYKKAHNIPILQSDRYGEILHKRCSQSCRLELNPDFIREIMQTIHEESVKEQM